MLTKLKISTPEPTNFEDILENLGGFGKYQIFILVVLLSIDFPSALIGLLPLFIGIEPDYWLCNGERLIESESDDICTCNGTLSAPSPFTSIVGEWNLICGTSWASDLITSVQMMGALVAALLSSQVADWYGRYCATIGLCIIFSIGSIMSALAPNVYVFALARFLCGAGSSGAQGLVSVYALEFMPTRWRSLPGAVRPYGETTILLGLFAYLFRPWRTLAWVTTGSVLLVSMLMLILPESPRWLMQNQKIEEAAKVLNRIASVNNRPQINVDVVRKIAQKEMSKNNTQSNGDPVDRKTNKNSYATIFKNSNLRTRAILLMTIWFSWSLVNFGLAFNLKNVPGDRYWNVVYMGIADSIGFPSTLLIINRFGRRISIIFSMSLGALFLVAISGIYLTTDWTLYPSLILCLYLFGKSSVAMSRTTLRCLTAESFPTAVRSMGSGLCGISLSLGAVICPQFAYLGTGNPSIPLLAFAFISVGGSLFAFFMAETEGKPLQDSVERKLSRRLSSIFMAFKGTSAVANISKPERTSCS